LPYANSTNSEQQPYKFGGKEYDEMHGLNWYDQGARPFGAVIPVTPTPDPLSEKYYSTSPYAQWGNNPVKYIDPDGREVFITGDDEFRKRAFEAFQKLTSSSLLMLKNGKVVDASNYSGSKKNISITGEGSGDK
jgi:RHS repeat-associated protein